MHTKADSVHDILIANPEYLSGDARRMLERLGHVTAKRVSRGELLHIIPDFDVLLILGGVTVDAELLRRAKRLRLIASATAGLDHIDLEHARKLNIKVVNLRGAHTVPTAEHTMALMLALCRRIPWANDSLRQGRWYRQRFVGTDLNGKVLGIVGLGKIGSLVARYARAFGMRVIAYDPYVTSRGVELVGSLDSLMRQSDIVSIHAVLTKETRDMIGTKQLREMKKGALLVNTARAGIINQRALLQALNSGRLAGAAIDVFESEPVSGAGDPLVRYARTHDNLILTPHLGASTKETPHAASIEIAKIIKGELGHGT